MLETAEYSSIQVSQESPLDLTAVRILDHHDETTLKWEVTEVKRINSNQEQRLKALEHFRDSAIAEKDKLIEYQKEQEL